MQDGIYRPVPAIPIKILIVLKVSRHPQPDKMFAAAKRLALANRAGGLKG
jgi:hypothetical protein